MERLRDDIFRPPNDRHQPQRLNDGTSRCRLHAKLGANPTYSGPIALHDHAPEFIGTFIDQPSQHFV
jgi:hypothetical protein